MIKIIEDKCDYCGSCVTVCPTDCIELDLDEISIDHPKCIDCNLCVYICPIDVLKIEH